MTRDPTPENVAEAMRAQGWDVTVGHSTDRARIAALEKWQREMSWLIGALATGAAAHGALALGLDTLAGVYVVASGFCAAWVSVLMTRNAIGVVAAWWRA